MSVPGLRREDFPRPGPAHLPQHRLRRRRPGAGNLYPADAALSLPASRHSHTLARLAALEAARGSFEAAHAAITRRCGPVIGKRPSSPCAQ